MDLADCTTLLIDRTLGEHLQVLGKHEGYVYKSGIWDTKPVISLKRSSLEPNLLKSVYRNSCTAYRIDWWHIWWPSVNFSLITREANSQLTNISHTSCRSATKFGSDRGLANRSLFPQFRELWSGGPVRLCGDMHLTFTGALVKWFWGDRL